MFKERILARKGPGLASPIRLWHRNNINGCRICVCPRFRANACTRPLRLGFLAAFWASVWFGGDGPGKLGLALSTLGLSSSSILKAVVPLWQL